MACALGLVLTTGAAFAQAPQQAPAAPAGSPSPAALGALRALAVPLVPLGAEVPEGAGTGVVSGGPCPEPDAGSLVEALSAASPDGAPGSGLQPASAPSASPAALQRPTAPPPAPPPVPIIVGPPLRFDRSHGVPRTPYGKQIYKIALRYALNPLVVAAVVEAESDFRPRAVSRKGACGLMQVLPSTARRFGYRRRDLFNPIKNLEAGARYLHWLVNRFGDDAMRVLAAYNAGEGSVERFGGLPPFQETRDYVQHIFTRLGFTLVVPGTEPAPFVGTR